MEYEDLQRKCVECWFLWAGTNEARLALTVMAGASVAPRGDGGVESGLGNRANFYLLETGAGGLLGSCATGWSW